MADQSCGKIFSSTTAFLKKSGKTELHIIALRRTGPFIKNQKAAT
jgi:hypothetical protein